MPTEAQLETVRSIFEAIALRDVDAAARHVSEDFELVTSAFITGQREFRGHEGVKRWFELVDELKGSGERVTIRPYSWFGDRAEADVILVVTTVTITRLEGEEIGAEAAYLFHMSGDKVDRVRGFLDHTDGLAELREPYELG